jgi:hypothetical protein
MTETQTAGWVQPEPEELFRQVRDLILTEPGLHYQRDWVRGFIGPASMGMLRTQYREQGSQCATRGCVAGWMVILGSQPETLIMGSSHTYVQLADSTKVSIHAQARKVSGMDEWQAEWLFLPFRSREEVLWALDQLIKDPAAEIWRGMP